MCPDEQDKNRLNSTGEAGWLNSTIITLGIQWAIFLNPPQCLTLVLQDDLK